MVCERTFEKMRKCLIALDICKCLILVFYNKKRQKGLKLDSSYIYFNKQPKALEHMFKLILNQVDPR